MNENNELKFDIPVELMVRIQVILDRDGITLSQFIDRAIAAAILKWDALPPAGP